jgi:hypothetical protein
MTALPKTNAGDPPPVPTVVEWACEQLDLASDQPVPSVRAHLLRLLEGEDFVPPQTWTDAIQFLAADGLLRDNGPAGDATTAELPLRRVPDPLPYRQHVEQHLSEVVSQAATSHLSVPIAERVSRLRQLELLCRDFPQLQRRVQCLFRAVRIEIPGVSPADEKEAALIEFFRESCGLGEKLQSRLRQQRLSEWSDDPNLHAAVIRMRLIQPAIAAQFPEMFRALIDEQRVLSLGQKRRRRRQRVQRCFVWVNDSLDSRKHPRRVYVVWAVMAIATAFFGYHNETSKNPGTVARPTPKANTILNLRPQDKVAIDRMFNRELPSPQSKASAAAPTSEQPTVEIRPSDKESSNTQDCFPPPILFEPEPSAGAQSIPP